MADNQTIPLKRPVNVPDFVLKQQTDVSQKIDSKYPTNIIPLPTKGVFYPIGHPLSSGEIELKEMSAKEEDLLANQQLIKSGKVLDKLMEALIVDKSIRIEDILIPDKNAIFIGIRQFSYGSSYPVSITCPHCSISNKVDINLNELKYKPFDFDNYPKGQNNFSFKLPNSGIVVTYKLLNQLDEKSIDAELEQIKKINKENTSELTTRLKYLLSSVDNNSDRASIRRFVEEKLSAKDSLALRKHMKEHNPDVDMSFDFKCSECNHERRLDVPIGASFLWPDLDR